MRWAAGALLLLVAAVATWARVEVPGSASVPVVLALAAPCALLLMIDLVRSGSVRRMPPAVAVLAALLLAHAATVAAGLLDPVYSALVRDAVEILMAGGTFAMLALVGGWWLAMRGAELRQRLAGALVLGIGVNCVVALMQVASFAVRGDDPGRLNVATGVPRAPGLSSDPNHLALAVVLALALLFALDWRSSARLAGCCVLVAGLAATGSRSGVSALVVACLLLGALSASDVVRRRSARRDMTVRSTLGVMGACMLLAGAALAPVLAIDSRVPGSLGDLVRRDVPGARVGGATDADRTGRTHLGVYALAPEWLEQHPVVGTGTGSFPGRFELLTGRGGFGAHSWYLRALLETGLAGLLTVLLVLAHCIACAFSQATRLGRGIGVALVATAVGNVSYLTMHLATWHLLLALAVSGIGAAAAAAPSVSRLRPPG